MKKVLNKWQGIFHLKDLEYHYPKTRKVFRFGIFKIKRFPVKGEALDKSCYNGFIWEWRFNNPLSILKRYLEHKGY